MIRILAAAGLAGCLVTPCLSQEPSAEDMLGSLFYTLAVIEYCGIEPAPAVGRNLAKAGYRLQTAVGLNNREALLRYEEVKLRLVASPPDCNESSSDLAGMVAILKGEAN